MEEDPFALEVKEIQAKLKKAIFEGNIQALPSMARELRRYWVIALVRGYRNGFKEVNNALLSVAGMAHSYADWDNPKDPLLSWYRICEFLGETGVMIQRIHTEWIAQDRLTEVVTHQFQHAEQTIRFLSKEGMATFANLSEHMRKAIEKGPNEETSQNTTEEKKRPTAATLNNHLRRLAGYGLVSRAGRGIYHLTSLGEQVAKLLEKREHRGKESEAEQSGLNVETETKLPESPRGLPESPRGNVLPFPGHRGIKTTCEDCNKVLMSEKVAS
ncbi:MAG: hypothetical protein HQL80_09460 [Magnetococcales bacterium]|nr:hypothetical protein [Magnetococcales bacterium]